MHSGAGVRGWDLGLGLGSGPRTRVGASDQGRSLRPGSEPQTRVGASDQGRSLRPGSGPQTRVGASDQGRSVRPGSEPQTRVGASDQGRGLRPGSEPQTRVGASDQGRSLRPGSEPQTRVGASDQGRSLRPGSEPQTRVGALRQALVGAPSQSLGMWILGVLGPDEVLRVGVLACESVRCWDLFILGFTLGIIMLLQKTRSGRKRCRGTECGKQELKGLRVLQVHSLGVIRYIFIS